MFAKMYIYIINQWNNKAPKYEVFAYLANAYDLVVIFAVKCCIPIKAKMPAPKRIAIILGQMAFHL